MSVINSLIKGSLKAKVVSGDEDMATVRRLREAAFGRCFGVDECVLVDDIDARVTLVLVTDERQGAPVASFRILPLASGAAIQNSYSARYYDLQGLRSFASPMLEVGRFCTHPDYRSNADVIRIAWAAITAAVDETGAAMLFGCSSFAGTRGDAYADTFALLRARHLAPARWAPGIRVGDVYPFARTQPPGGADPRRGLMLMPPLLRSYLSMGGWVSDHAVVDRQMNTLHVFTGLEVDAIPAARVKRLRALLAS